MDDNANVQTLEAERDRLDKLKEDFNEAHRAFDEVIDSEKDKQDSYQWFDIRDRECFEVRAKLVGRIHTLEQIKPKSRPRSVKSNYSKGSKSSFPAGKTKASRSAMKLEAAARTARLKAEMTFFKRDSEMRRFQLMKDIAIAEAEERAIKETLEQEQHDEIKQKTSIELDPSATPFVPELPLNEPQETRVRENFDKGPPVLTKREENQDIKQESDPIGFQPFLPTQPIQDHNTNDPCHESPKETLKELISLQAKQTELSSLLIQQQKRINLPAKEPPVFSGNAFDYPAFTTAFDSIISENVPSNKDRLYFLNKYTAGKANEVVKGFLAVNSEHSYIEARKLLEQRFGNPIHVAEAYKSRLRNWPQIRDGDSAGLQDFSGRLAN